MAKSSAALALGRNILLAVHFGRSLMPLAVSETRSMHGSSRLTP
jgi:hypothetical protein